MTKKELKRRWFKAKPYTVEQFYYGWLYFGSCLPSVKDVLENIKMNNISLKIGE